MSHNGADAFTFRIAFSEPVATGDGTLEDALTVTGGEVTSASHVNGSSDLWQIIVMPNTDYAVTVTLPVTRDCADEGAVCTAAGEKLSAGDRLFIPGPATPDNYPAAGWPTIGGTPQVGETLTVHTSGISDGDGLTNVSYSYQWLADDADIEGKTDSTYVVSDDDVGKAIKVRVSFADDRSNTEALTSDATAEIVERQQRSPFLVSNLNVGVGGAAGIQRTLNAARSGFAQAFTTGTKAGGYALGSVGIQVTDFADGSAVGGRLQVTVNGVAGGGVPGDAHCTLTNPSSFSTPGLIAFEAPTGAGSCPQLAAGTTYFVVIEWVDPSGSDAFAIIPQTYSTRESAATDEDTGGAEGWSIADKSYYLTVASNARTWTVYDETASFKIEVQEAAARDNSPATGLPTIDGTAQADQTLTANTDGIADADGLTYVSYSYQWLADDADIDGATGSTYVVSDDDVGKAIKVRVTLTDDANNQETLTSEPTAAVGPPPLTVSVTAAPPSTHDGLADFTFEIEFSDEPEPSFSYTTLRDHAFNVTGGTVTKAGRLDAPSNIGWRITVQPHSTGDVTIVLPVTTDCGALWPICTEDGRKLSNRLEITVPGPERAVQNTEASGAPTIEGTAQAGQTLTASTTDIADADGLDNVSYSYQWIRNDGTTDTDIEGAEDPTYDLSDDDVGKTIKVRVTFTDDRNNVESLTSAATAAVAAAPSDPLTVSVTVAPPATHDGSSEFIFEIAFSEEPKSDFSFRTLKFHAFDVTGGTILKAQRTDPNRVSNIGWKITVRPDSNGDVTIVLPVTTDCGAQGAICTDDDRKLSNRLEMTVSGPSG